MADHQWQNINAPVAGLVRATCGQRATRICPVCGHVLCEAGSDCPDCEYYLAVACRRLNPPGCERCGTEITFEETVNVGDPPTQACAGCALGLALSGQVDPETRIDLSVGELMRLLASAVFSG